jgi:hypothetical protein
MISTIRSSIDLHVRLCGVGFLDPFLEDIGILSFTNLA